MIVETEFLELLAKHARSDTVHLDDVLFGSGLNLSSIRFTEFIMDLEEAHDTDIDVDALDNSITTAGQLLDFLNRG